MLHSWSTIPVDEMSAESWINEVRGELAHAGSVIGPGSPVADNLKLSASTSTSYYFSWNPSGFAKIYANICIIYRAMTMMAGMLDGWMQPLSDFTQAQWQPWPESQHIPPLEEGVGGKPDSSVRAKQHQTTKLSFRDFKKFNILTVHCCQFR